VRAHTIYLHTRACVCHTVHIIRNLAVVQVGRIQVDDIRVGTIYYYLGVGGAGAACLPTAAESRAVEKRKKKSKNHPKAAAAAILLMQSHPPPRLATTASPLRRPGMFLETPAHIFIYIYICIIYSPADKLFIICVMRFVFGFIVCRFRGQNALWNYCHFISSGGRPTFSQTIELTRWFSNSYAFIRYHYYTLYTATITTAYHYYRAASIILIYCIYTYTNTSTDSAITLTELYYEKHDALQQLLTIRDFVLLWC